MNTWERGGFISGKEHCTSVVRIQRDEECLNKKSCDKKNEDSLPELNDGSDRAIVGRKLSAVVLPTVFGVPMVSAVLPREHFGERRDEVKQDPRHNHHVVDIGESDYCQ